MDLNRSALQTVPEKRCFPFLTVVYFVCSMETGTDTLLFRHRLDAYPGRN